MAPEASFNGQILQEDSAEIGKQWASLVTPWPLSMDIDEDGLEDGLITPGGDLHQEVMTIEEAKRLCSQLTGCKGFTFEGSPTIQPVMVFFKNKYDVVCGTPRSGRWTSFNYEVWAEKHGASDGASARFYSKPQVHSNYMSLPMQPVLEHDVSSRSYPTVVVDVAPTYQYSYSTGEASSIRKVALPRPEMGSMRSTNFAQVALPRPEMGSMGSTNFAQVQRYEPLRGDRYVMAPFESERREWRPLGNAYDIGWAVGQHGVVDPIYNIVYYVGEMLTNSVFGVGEVAVKPVGFGVGKVVGAAAVGAGQVVAFGAGIGSGITYGALKPPVSAIATVGHDYAVKPISDGVKKCGSTLASIPSALASMRPSSVNLGLTDKASEAMAASGRGRDGIFRIGNGGGSLAKRCPAIALHRVRGALGDAEEGLSSGAEYAVDGLVLGVDYTADGVGAAGLSFEEAVRRSSTPTRISNRPLVPTSHVRSSSPVITYARPHGYPAEDITFSYPAPRKVEEYDGGWGFMDFWADERVRSRSPSPPPRMSGQMQYLQPQMQYYASAPLPVRGNW